MCIFSFIVDFCQSFNLNIDILCSSYIFFHQISVFILEFLLSIKKKSYGVLKGLKDFVFWLEAPTRSLQPSYTESTPFECCPQSLILSSLCLAYKWLESLLGQGRTPQFEKNKQTENTIFFYLYTMISILSTLLILSFFFFFFATLSSF